ncbi:slingshot protein phosphatase 3 [Phyllostomus discolor]|uniref:protein-serine/threonine phosphatase n=1 Tax=Phyllostomus discolor TaxID=89673 RepID=A0A834E7F2_9CHIR|nr:slingshot protein phosphatase 3 [Phyllostomus discolor]
MRRIWRSCRETGRVPGPLGAAHPLSFPTLGRPSRGHLVGSPPGSLQQLPTQPPTPVLGPFLPWARTWARPEQPPCRPAGSSLARSSLPTPWRADGSAPLQGPLASAPCHAFLSFVLHGRWDTPLLWTRPVSAVRTSRSRAGFRDQWKARCCRPPRQPPGLVGKRARWVKRLARGPSPLLLPALCHPPPDSGPRTEQKHPSRPGLPASGPGAPATSAWPCAPAPPRCRVSHILNMAREIDNFYPERFTYHNVRLWDEESAQLLPHWKETHGFVEAARAQGTRVLVHCKMGVSRSAATVVAYAMKQYGWSLEQALRHVQELRPIARPNPGFLRQLQTYQGILTASRQSHVWEQKVGGASPEEPLAPEVSTPFPPPPPEPGGSGEVMAVGLEESQASAREEPGPRPRINLRGVMRSISLLEPPPELESASEAGDLPEVFSSNESSEKDPPQPSPQLSKAEGGPQAHKGSWPALKSHQSVAALNSAALVASRTRAFQEQGQVQEQEEAGHSSAPRVRKVVRQASVDGSGEEGEA